jgi:hypothetical protein
VVKPVEEPAPKDIVKDTAPKPLVKKEDGPATEAELKLKEEADLAKKKLIEEIKQFKTEEDTDKDD